MPHLPFFFTTASQVHILTALDLNWWEWSLCVCLPESNSRPSGGRDMGMGRLGDLTQVRQKCVFVHEHCQEAWQGLGSMCPEGKEFWDVFVCRWMCAQTNTRSHTLQLIGRRQLLPTRRLMWKYSSCFGPQAATPHLTIYPYGNEHQCSANSFPI